MQSQSNGFFYRQTPTRVRMSYVNTEANALWRWTRTVQRVLTSRRRWATATSARAQLDTLETTAVQVLLTYALSKFSSDTFKTDYVLTVFRYSCSVGQCVTAIQKSIYHQNTYQITLSCQSFHARASAKSSSNTKCLLDCHLPSEPIVVVCWSGAMACIMQ